MEIRLLETAQEDLREIAEHYRKLEKELRESGRFKFADEEAPEARAANGAV